MPNNQANFVDFLRLILSSPMYKEQHLKNQAIAPPYAPNAPAVRDIKQIIHMLPHRYPFQMVDKIIHLDAQSVTGVKNVTINEPFFQGHFPGNPIMPGVLQVEALAQTGGVLVLSTVPDPENYLTYFLGIDAFRFRKMVVPGDTLVLHCELLADIKRGFSKMQGRVFVGDQLACEATMLAQITKNK
jgi:UDP-3-O-[3-hydroxymyristoyl] N-acetylglucosamine deacetylase/3-hydroxyacyl-[acyl-carrier-protein] dehydratase